MHKQKWSETSLPLTLAKLAQLGRHETVNTQSEQYSLRVKGLC